MEQPHFKTPHLTTALTGPLQLLEKTILSKEKIIEAWFDEQWARVSAPVYGSVDLRNAGFKLAPVDMNLFPAGFNNLNPEFLHLSYEAAKIAIHKYCREAKKILLIPENHTRNLFYWENIKTLLQILHHAGFEVKIGSLLPDIVEPLEINLANNEKIMLYPIHAKQNILQIENFIPDVILLNNDLSSGIPSILENVSQPVIPPAKIGWSNRLKSEHFQFYADVSAEFADFLGIDPWLIAPLFRQCGKIDFMRNEGENCIATHVENLLTAVQKKYDEYQIDYKPYIVVKADAGTYGMAIMIARSGDDVRDLNRKERTAMSKTKGGQLVDSVIVQEGVYTFETWGQDNVVAEPVVYMWGQRVVGGFYRVHQDRGIDENLNSPGMRFEPLAFVKSCHAPLANASQDECQNRFYAYGVIARLSMLAAAREILELQS